MTNPITHLYRLANRRPHHGGFTLLEAMMAMSIGAITTAAAVTTYIYSVKAFQAISNYAQIHGDGRLAIDQFARDMRAVYQVVSVNQSNLVVKIPVVFSNTGGVTSNKTVTYSLSGGKLYRTDSSLSGSKLLAENIHELTFTPYDRALQTNNVLSVMKGIQVDIKLRKYVISQIQSEDYLSARLDMRNKP